MNSYFWVIFLFFKFMNSPPRSSTIDYTKNKLTKTKNIIIII